MTAFASSGRNLIDLPVAALAGVAVAFAAFTIPAEVLGEAVGATGLPSLLPAAQPPLGDTARAALAMAGALLAFAGAFLLLRWLDRFAARPAGSATNAPPVQIEEPRLRRADAHPDAPPRRPISAARDLGEPAPARPPEQWLEDLQPPARRAAPALSSAPVVSRPAAAVPAPAVPVTAAPAPAAASLTDLMARLERGLVKREAAAAVTPEIVAPAAPKTPQTPAPMSAPPPIADDRLQSAIESLQRLAAHG